jgi:hypothetical protein
MPEKEGEFFEGNQMFPHVRLMTSRYFGCQLSQLKIWAWHLPAPPRVSSQPGFFFFIELGFSEACFFFALAFSHRLLAAFRANSFLSSGVSEFMRDLPPLGPPFLPPRFPISRMTREIVSSFTSIVYRPAIKRSKVFSCMPEALVVKHVMLEAVLA